MQKTAAEWLAERAAVFSHFQEMEAQRTAEIAERQQKAAEFARTAQARRDAWERGEIAPMARQEPGQLLNQAFRDRLAEHAVEERTIRRQIEASPEHQRMVADLSREHPAFHKQWVKEHIAQGEEPSPAQAWAMLQDARVGLSRAQKQYDAVRAQPWSEAELAYAKAQCETAEAAARGALDLFNELSRTPAEQTL